jgi:hypothetical protein
MEPDFDLLLGVLFADFLNKKGARAAHFFIAAGSFLRCTGRCERQERPGRSKRSYTPSRL